MISYTFLQNQYKEAADRVFAIDRFAGPGPAGVFEARRPFCSWGPCTLPHSMVSFRTIASADGVSKIEDRG